MSWFDFREPVSAWTHFAWLLLSVPATLVLWRRGRGDRGKQLSLLVFGVSLALCYAGSTLYHAVRLPQDVVEGWFQTLDYIGIYLLIAGTMTPLAVVVLPPGPWRWTTLAVAWGLAAVGIVLRLLPLGMSRSLSTALYLGMGWAVLLCYVKLVRILSHRSLLPVVVGGMFYCVGAVFNWVHWPGLWPGAFSTHDFYHLFVMAGSLCHFWFMYTVVAPMERPVGSRLPDTAAGAGSESVPPLTS